MYFLAKARFNEFIGFLDELTKLPRNAELDGEAVIGAFGRAYGIGNARSVGSGVDQRRFMGIGLEWADFMGQEQSPSRRLKLDDIVANGPPAEERPALLLDSLAVPAVDLESVVGQGQGDVQAVAGPVAAGDGQVAAAIGRSAGWSTWWMNPEDFDSRRSVPYGADRLLYEKSRNLFKESCCVRRRGGLT